MRSVCPGIEVGGKNAYRESNESWPGADAGGAEVGGTGRTKVATDGLFPCGRRGE